MSELEQFRDTIRAAGLEPPAVIEPGKLHRFATNGKRADDSGWCKLFNDRQGGVFGDFRTGLSETWQAKRAEPFTSAEREAFRQRCEREKRERETEEARRHAEAAKKALEILQGANDDPALHPYAVKKAVPLGSLVKRGSWPQREWDDALLVPVYGADGKIWTIEAISADGDKDFLAGGKKRAGFHPFGRIRGAAKVLIGEGLATVAATFQATGIPGIAAMDGGNLEHAARAVKQLAPSAEIIFLADNDITTNDKNSGIDAATLAARVLGGRIAVPELDGRKCDFWDLWYERGAEAVVKALTNGREVTSEANNGHHPFELLLNDTESDFSPFSHQPRTPEDQPKARLEPEALHGLAGEIVLSIAPYTEADPVALLLNSLAAFGSMIGCSAYAAVQNDQHPGRLFVAQVGPTAKGRKGTGWSPIKYLFSLVDPEWTNKRVKTGLSSGEGLIYNVRDPVYKRKPITDEQGRVIDYEEVLDDPGESDKRLMIIEPEFASTLTVMGREGNILSAVMRQAWDDGNLSPLTRNNPITSTGAHITLIAHITLQELLSRLDDTSKANGFANRFLWALVERSKELPEGAMVPDEIMSGLAEKASASVAFARRGGIVKRDEPTRELWAQVYGPLSAGKPGLTGAILSRAEAQVLRLSVIYALLDCSLVVRVTHLKAALALWEYCEASAGAIFGNRLGDPLADRILDALRAAAREGMSDNEIYEFLGRNRSAKERDRALALLLSLKIVRKEKIKETGGRPETRWWATCKT